MPELGPFSYYVNAFAELSTTRPSSFGVGPIPFTAIAEYVKIYEVEDFDDFLYFIRLMDSAVLKQENKENKPNGGNSGKKNRSKN